MRGQEGRGFFLLGEVDGKIELVSWIWDACRQAILRRECSFSAKKQRIFHRSGNGIQETREAHVVVHGSGSAKRLGIALHNKERV